MKQYGYCRVSTPSQNLERQIDAIREAYPEAIIITEKYTGKSLDRPQWSKLVKKLRAGDTVIFESVSRMSRNAAEGYQTYKDLYEKNINLVFIAQPFVNTDVYRSSAQKQIDLTISTGNTTLDSCLNGIIDNINALIMELASQQIPKAFEASEAEVTEKSRNTAQGVKKARDRFDREEALGLEHEKMRPGRQTGAKITTKKAAASMEIIKKHSMDFGGSLSDSEVIKLAGCSRNSFYKYKRELKEKQE